jgi:predicted  nucleic acid-binding Zn-ribbon protein
MELRKLKQRELDFREELERGMQSNQERLLSLQEKCGQLEKENQQLRESGEAVSATHLKNPKDISYISDLPENVEELKSIIASLIDERSSLMNLAGKLKSQFDDESRKNRDTIDRINNLLIDLSGKSQE